jgi:hypothetical protein
MKRLPDGCTCPITERTKLKHYLNSAIKEIQLMKAILFENHTPKVLAGKEIITPKIEELPCLVRLTIKIKPEDWRKVRSFILLDREGKPLYRKTRRNFGLVLSKKDSCEISWLLGAY